MEESGTVWSGDVEESVEERRDGTLHTSWGCSGVEQREAELKRGVGCEKADRWNTSH